MRYALLLVAVAVLFAGCAVPMAGDSTDQVDGDCTDSVPTDRSTAPAEDTLGWHDGYWYDDAVTVNETDGLNDTELDAVTARATARVECLRGLEFDESVEVDVVSRSSYSGNPSTEKSESGIQTFDDTTFETLFLVGDDDSASEEQAETQSSSVGGFYSPRSGDVVVISESETPRVDIGVLAHELTHGLQDQQLQLATPSADATRDESSGRLGLIEGDASVVEFEYEDRCDAGWDCIEYPSEETDGPAPEELDLHMGIYITEFFPYSDGPAFVEQLRDGDDWSAVNDAHADPPVSSREVINPDDYASFEPETVDLEDRNADSWDRVRRQGGPDYEVLGQSALSAMFSYTLYEESNPDTLVQPFEFLNMEEGEVNQTDPLNYDLESTQGWTGDRLHIYENDTETAYVWRITWESAADAQQFTDTYHELLQYWGGEQMDDETWTIGADGQFTGAYHVNTGGDTVTITNAPSTAALDDVREPAN